MHRHVDGHTAKPFEVPFGVEHRCAAEADLAQPRCGVRNADDDVAEGLMGLEGRPLLLCVRALVDDDLSGLPKRLTRQILEQQRATAAFACTTHGEAQCRVLLPVKIDGEIEQTLHAIVI